MKNKDKLESNKFEHSVTFSTPQFKKCWFAEMNVHGYSSTIMAAALNMDLGFESAESKQVICLVNFQFPLASKKVPLKEPPLKKLLSIITRCHCTFMIRRRVVVFVF